MNHQSQCDTEPAFWGTHKVKENKMAELRDLLRRPVLQEIGLQRNEKREHDRVEDHHQGCQYELGVGDDRH